MNERSYGVGDFLRCLRELAPQTPFLERRLAEHLCPELLEAPELVTSKTSARPTAELPALPANWPALASNGMMRQVDTAAADDATAEPPLLTDWIRIHEHDSTPALPTDPFPVTRGPEAMIGVEPLFPPARARALLGTLASALRPEGPLDVERMVETLSRAVPIEKIPRIFVRSLRGGVEVLADLSVAMQPFRADQEALVTRLEDVVGKTLVRVGDFEDCPTRHGEGAKDYTPPARGTLVLVLTDFGVASRSNMHGGASAREWAACGRTLAQAGCFAVGLCPYPARRIPREITRWFKVVHWDRKTRVGAARRIQGRGRAR